MKYMVVAAAALLMGCSSPEKARFEQAYNNCTDLEGGWNCELRSEGLHINFEGYEAVWALSVGHILGPLELPDEILMRLKNYRPIDGTQEWKYRDVTMLFNYSRTTSYGVTRASSDVLLFQ